MFDTTKVAKRIKEARVAQNLTQMQLADAMGVSYQAVSNWERGNSMPDISKLEDLCKALAISLEELLGTEQGTNTVYKLLTEDQPELTLEELGDVAPMLPPKQVHAQAEQVASGKPLHVAALAEIAPFMDEALLEELVSDAEPEHLADLESLAPFLSEALLDKLVRRAPMGAPEEITTLAPFLSEDTLSFLVQRCETLSDYQLLNELLPFLNAQALDDLARRSFGNPEVLEQLAPFLSEESLDTVADLCLQSGNLQHLTPLFPFLGSRAMRKVAKALMAAGNLEALKEAAPFL